MITDLIRVISPHGCAEVLGLRLRVLKRYERGYQRPGNGLRRHIWSMWANICRPGQVVTVFDLATWGRFTALGGPEHAGSPALRRPAK